MGVAGGREQGNGRYQAEYGGQWGAGRQGQWVMGSRKRAVYGGRDGTEQWLGEEQDNGGAASYGTGARQVTGRQTQASTQSNEAQAPSNNRDRRATGEGVSR